MEDKSLDRQGRTEAPLCARLPCRPDKPRRRGITAVIDFGPGVAGWTTPQGVEDFLSITDDFVDLAKIYALNSLLLPKDPLRKIVETYRRHDVEVYAGGILFEFALQNDSVAQLPQLLKELGIGALEVSENYLVLTPDERRHHVDWLKSQGLSVVYEFGRKNPEAAFDPDELEKLVLSMNDCGVEHVIVEQSEIDQFEATAPGSTTDLARQAWFANVLIECDPNRYPKQHAGLVTDIGPEVNLANVTPAQVMALECMRRGIGRPVDYALITHPERFEIG